MADVITDIGRTYLRWALTDGVGPLTFSRLLVQLENAEAALGAPVDRLRDVVGIGEQKAARIARSRDEVDIEPEIDAAEMHDVRIICRADDDYPRGLRHIPDAPIVLYTKGELRDTDAVAVAIVGSRRCTIYGSEQARRFGELLAGAGFTVVSGLARGIDAFAHHGAVDAGGRSIAVMGRGLTEIYPPENASLAARLLDHGAWLSELPMQAAVRAENFPGRNRIIAGMTLGTIVVEAAQRSGALITARLASEYNREVFAVPGRAQDAMSQGTNALIRDGAAKLVTCLEDVLDELGDVGTRLRRSDAAATVRDERRQQPSPGNANNRQDPSLFDGGGPASSAPARTGGATRTASLSAVEQRVLDAVGFDPVLQDVVISAAGLPAGEVLAAMTSLELKGHIKRLPGNLVVRHGRA